MAKSKPKKTKKGKSGGFIARMFDVFTALIIIAVIGAAVWYWFFYSERKGGHSIKESIKGLYEKESGAEDNEKDKKAEKQAQPAIDENADDEYMESVDSDIIGGEDAIANQYEDELASNYSSSDAGSQNYSTDGFYRSVNKWASKYKGLKVKSNADPDEDNATDNSHLICSIWEHAANENGRKFKGYISSDKILDHLYSIGKKEFRNGDLIVLKDGMFGMIINYKNSDSYELIYASGEKNKVVIIDVRTMKNYWLTPEKFKGYYRAEKEVLN
jgi:hypothetical protein